MKPTDQPLTTSANPVSPSSSEPATEAAAEAFNGESAEVSESTRSPACPTPAMNNPSTGKPWWVLLGFDGCLVIVLSLVTVYTFFDALTCSHFQSCNTATVNVAIEVVALMSSTITFGLAALARRGFLW